MKYRTIEEYSVIVNKYLKPHLGHYRLNKITSYQFNQFLIKMCMHYDYSYEYFKNFLKVIKSSFRAASDIFGFINNNPAITLRLPMLELLKKSNRHVYTEEEIDIILKRFKNDKVFVCSFLTAYYTGMRTGEVFALTWNDIDFNERTIRIEHDVYCKSKDEKGRWFLGTVKTINSTRKIYISDTLFEILLKYKQRQDNLKMFYGKDYHYYHLEQVKNEYGKVIEKRIVETTNKSRNQEQLNFIFVRDNGNYMGTDIIRYPYKVIHDELGIINCRFYDLRGSFATKALRNGVEIKDVSDILGHSNIETTENYYIYSSTDNQRRATELLESVIQSETIDNTINNI